MRQASARTSGNEREREETTRYLPLLAEMPAPRLIELALVKACANARQALSLCIRASGFTDERVAQLIGISKGYLSKVLNGRASLDGDRRIRLMRVCGNLAPAQFEAQQFGLHLGQRDPQDVLREALSLIEQRRAAA